MREEIIGRDREVSIIASFVADVRGSPTALLLEGEAGIGKSILWRHAIDAAAGSRRVVSSRPSEADEDVSFAVLNDLLDPLLSEHPPAVASPRRRALEIALLRTEGTSEPADPQGVAFGALDVVRGAAREQPLLIAVDDGHWIDGSSAGVLRFVFRRLQQEPVAIVLTARADASPHLAGLDASISRLEHVKVGALSVGAINRLIASRLGMTAPRHILIRLHEQSGGNPFYALEIARGLVRRGLRPGPHEPLPIPDSLSELVSDRISSLTVATQHLLRWASAMPQPKVEALRVVAGDDTIDEDLSEAVRAGILELDAGRVRFAHPLLASVVYAGLRPAERRQMHVRLATAVGDPEERARHLALGTDGQDEAVAIAIEDGARRAAKRGALGEAAALYEQALRVTPSGSSTDAHQRALEAVDLHLEAGEAARAAEMVERLIGSTPSGDQRASLLYRLAIIRGRAGDLVDEERLLMSASSEAGRNPRIRAEIEQELALVALVTRADLPKAVAHARDSVGWAERAGDPALLVTSLVALAGHAFMRGEGVRDDLLRRAEAIRGAAEARRVQRLPLLDLDVCWGILLKWADEFDASRARLEQRYRRALEAGEESMLPFILCHLSELECWTGGWDLAERYATQAINEARLSEQPWMLPPALYSSALIDAHLGRSDEARAAAEQAFEASERVGIITIMILAKTVLGFIELSLGNAAGADEHLGGIPEQLEAMGAREPGVPRCLADAIEARIGIGDLEGAETLTDRFEEMGRAVDRPWALATGARCRGLLQAAHGDLEGATASLERALAAHERLAMPFELGRTLMVAGIVDRRAKRKRAAKDSLDRALDIFERLGAPLWADKARAELGRIGIRPQAPSTLTATEQRVAELAALGHSNKEVADALFMSVKTVESNLSRIYRKLHVRSRTELARRFGESAHEQAPEELGRPAP
jgi:DNA-binding CsgD family transcriptional regulator